MLRTRDVTLPPDLSISNLALIKTLSSPMPPRRQDDIMDVDSDDSDALIDYDEPRRKGKGKAPKKKDKGKSKVTEVSAIPGRLGLSTNPPSLGGCS